MTKIMANVKALVSLFQELKSIDRPCDEQLLIKYLQFFSNDLCLTRLI